MKALWLAAFAGIIFALPSITLGHEPKKATFAPSAETGKKWVRIPVGGTSAETLRVLVSMHEACSLRPTAERKLCYDHWQTIPAASEQPVLSGEIQYYDNLYKIWMRITQEAYCSLKELPASNRNCRKEWAGLADH